MLVKTDTGLLKMSKRRLITKGILILTIVVFFHFAIPDKTLRYVALFVTGLFIRGGFK